MDSSLLLKGTVPGDFQALDFSRFDGPQPFDEHDGQAFMFAVKIESTALHGGNLWRMGDQFMEIT